ncbi:MAG: hypothetical protein ACRENG_35710 [bacterium]
MRKSFFVACLFFLMIGVLIGCQSTGKNEAANSAPQTNGASVESKPGEQHQYRAVCIEKAEHGGNEYVLSKWFDSRDKANELGQYHGDFKYKGHRWRIDERVKPEQAKP